MRQYYIHYYTEDFPNAYRLYYTNGGAEKQMLPTGAKRITRNIAEKLARQERYRQKHSRPNAGYADAAVFPVDYDRARSQICKDDRYVLADWIWVHHKENP